MTRHWVIDLSDLSPDELARAGGKAVSLSRMSSAGLRVPRGLGVLTEAYSEFVQRSGVHESIGLELGRKRFEDMRWEELWDTSLRIRNAFLRARWPTELRNALTSELSRVWGDDLSRTPLAVRSSAPGEDARSTSFAGLHESLVNVRGTDSVLEAIRKVWASLWSDRALLYRRELGLEVRSSAMAVVVQEMVSGTCSGVMFTRSPTDPGRMVVEAVWGLNEGLVDGTVEPDHWELDRGDGSLLEHREATRACLLTPIEEGVRLEPLPVERRGDPPLDGAQLAQVVELGRRAEALFGAPQDVEWTIRDGIAYTLQARPISTGTASDPATGDAGSVPPDPAGTPAVGRSDRAWYLSLTRSLENLKILRRRLEEEEIPRMLADAERMASVDVCALDDESLAREIEKRKQMRDGWLEVYWRDFIPFAHGMRLFGQTYNDDVAPDDPFEFITLLTGGRLVGVERNRLLRDLAATLAQGADRGRTPDAPGDETRELEAQIDAYLDRFGSGPNADDEIRRRERTSLISLLRRLGGSSHVELPEAAGNPQLAESYLNRFQGSDRAMREELLDLARASYELRDNDNLYLDRIEAQLKAAVAEGARRIGSQRHAPEDLAAADAIRSFEDPTTVTGDTRGHEAAGAAATEEAGKISSTSARGGSVSADVSVRQMVGQPAGPGLGSGKARVVRGHDDLFEFQEGEVLVCDSLDPTMTFVAPLASAIVERRGGMLIHGAIIAREYGLPCVTGVPMATEVITTGDLLTVDGYLGIVVVTRDPSARTRARRSDRLRTSHAAGAGDQDAASR